MNELNKGRDGLNIEIGELLKTISMGLLNPTKAASRLKKFQMTYWNTPKR